MMPSQPMPPRQLPRVVVIAAVIATGGATAWAMSATRMRGPETSWGVSQTAVNQVWADPASAQRMAAGSMAGAMPQQPLAPTTMPNPGGAGLPPMGQPQGRPVAGLPGVPNIINGSVRPHGDRGACTNCHGIQDRRGRQVPSITADAMMPHSFRGTCSNCHQIVVGGALRDIAATVALPGGGIASPSPGNARAMAPPRDADWLGMEVRAADRGVIVTKAEGAAARGGLQPGDRVGSINGRAVRNMADFIIATDNGALAQGAAIVDRGGQRLAFELLPRPRAVGPGRAAPQVQDAQFAPMQPMQSMQPAQLMQPMQPARQAQGAMLPRAPMQPMQSLQPMQGSAPPMQAMQPIQSLQPPMQALQPMQPMQALQPMQPNMQSLRPMPRNMQALQPSPQANNVQTAPHLRQQPGFAMQGGRR